MRPHYGHVSTKFGSNWTKTKPIVGQKPPKNGNYDVIASRRRCVVYMVFTLIDVYTWYHAMYKISVQSDARSGPKTAQNGRINTLSRTLWRHSGMTSLRRDWFGHVNQCACVISAYVPNFEAIRLQSGPWRGPNGPKTAQNGPKKPLWRNNVTRSWRRKIFFT